MERFDPDVIERMLAQYQIPPAETAEDVLRQVKPQRRYLGPGFWFQELQRRVERTDDDA